MNQVLQKRVLIIFGLLVFAVLTFLLGCAWMIGNALSPDKWCQNNVYKRIPSPDKTREVVVWQADCGATSSIYFQFSLVKFGEADIERNGKEFFFLDPHDNSNQYIVEWKTDYQIVIRMGGEHGGWDSVGTRVPEVDSIRISYQ
jgi:hypothetical protein